MHQPVSVIRKYVTRADLVIHAPQQVDLQQAVGWRILALGLDDG